MSRMVECVRRVEKLSKDALGPSAKRLTLDMKKVEAELVAHLAEMKRRRVVEEWGFAGLFQYCQAELGMSEGEAALRLQVAAVCRRCPEVLDRLAEGRISLTVAGRIAPHLTSKNATELLDDCEGMTRREVAEYVVRFKPCPKVSSGVRAAGSRSPGAKSGRSTGTEGPGGGTPNPGSDRHSGTSSAQSKSERRGPEPGGEEPASDELFRAVEGASSNRGESLDSSEHSRGSGSGFNSSVDPATAEEFNFRFSAGRALKEKIERLGEVAGIVNPLGKLDVLIEMAVELALDKKDPQRRWERREARKAAKTAAASKGSERKAPTRKTAEGRLADSQSVNPEAAETSCATGVGTEFEPRAGSGADGAPPSGRKPSRPDETADRSRYIPVELRDRVLARSGWRCEYVGEDRRRCDQRIWLEIDHVVPFAKGGQTSFDNLRCLCRCHNRVAAEQQYGKEFMSKKIRAASPSKGQYPDGVSDSRCAYGPVDREANPGSTLRKNRISARIRDCPRTRSRSRGCAVLSGRDDVHGVASNSGARSGCAGRGLAQGLRRALGVRAYSDDGMGRDPESRPDEIRIEHRFSCSERLRVLGSRFGLVVLTDEPSCPDETRAVLGCTSHRSELAASG